MNRHARDALVAALILFWPSYWLASEALDGFSREHDRCKPAIHGGRPL